MRRAWLLRRSVDARRKSDVHFVATVGVADVGVFGDCDVPSPVVPFAQRPVPDRRESATRPVVVGTGPAGLFAALELAEAGLCPLVVERGAPVAERAADVERFCRTRVLDTASNVQFGEGGAGTFSDGKLTCGKNSPLTREVLEAFVAAGAPADVLWQAKPHMGTDVLGAVVASMRERIVACGGEVCFHTRLVGFRYGHGPAAAGAGRSVRAVLLEREGVVEEHPACQVVLATGHSARDTFALLRDDGFELEQKPFSVGVRIEHPQEQIDRAQYGRAFEHPALGAADYKLSCHLDSGRGVYTFCMCPGGEVVAAASEDGGLCVNGMSCQARDGANANAAVLVNVDPSDFPDARDPLSGIAFQRQLEQAAFTAGGADWSAPVQTVGSFLGDAQGRRASVDPSYPLGVREAELSSCLPGFAVDAICAALPVFGRKLRGYDDAGALMTGVEARSSSPVRIVRDRGTLQATRVAGVYPAGEGAGYAGGIMSAAIDGKRAARAVLGSARA